MKDQYVVWVGGVADYEGDSLEEAKSVHQEWIMKGYDDAILEYKCNTPLQDD